MEVKVSVVIPVYNVAPYIENCARSLFEQTLNQVEYIFIDDCSPDNSIDIVKNVLHEYPSREIYTRFYKMPQNSGLPSVRKKGIELAKGDYVIHCDSDDTVKPKMLEVMYRVASEGNYDMVTCEIDWSNNYVSYLYECKDKLDLIKSILTGRVIESVCTKLVRKSIYETSGFIYTKDNVNEDCVFSIQLAYYCRSFKQLPDKFYNYFMRTDSISHVVEEEKMINNYNQFKRNVDLIEFFLKSISLNKEVEKELDIKKLSCKNYITPIVHRREYKKLWNNTYKDIKGIILFNNLISVRKRIIYYCIKFNLYKTLRPIFTKAND